MNDKRNKAIELISISILRIIIGWHILYEGVSKLITPGWSSRGFLSESKWVLSGFTEWIINNEGVLNIVNLLNTWGLIAIGAGLILGLFTRVASASGAILLLAYYLCNPPLIGMEYTAPMEGNYLLFNKTLIEAIALFVLAVSAYSPLVGMDLLLLKFKKTKI